jgi:hypothetical protein
MGRALCLSFILGVISMSMTKAMRKAVRTMTEAELHDTGSRLSARLQTERNPMVRASFRDQLAIVQVEVDRRDANRPHSITGCVGECGAGCINP